MRRFFATFVLLLAHGQLVAQARLESVRYWKADDQVRVVLNVNGPLEHSVFLVDNPDRVVVDLKNVRLAGPLPQPDVSDQLLKKMRAGVQNGHDLRLVLDLHRKLQLKTQLLDGNGEDRRQISIELNDPGASKENRVIPAARPTEPQVLAQQERTEPPRVAEHEPSKAERDKAQARHPRSRGEQGHPKAEHKIASTETKQAVGSEREPPRQEPRPKQSPEGNRDVVVAIDAGHGGNDPGALGTNGTREKDVTLAIARRLAQLVNREPGLKAVLVRDDDRFIHLRDRMEIARKHRADLFVSIHADAYTDSSVKGSSVFTLSRNGASSEAARWLAAKENSADLVGGVSLDDKDDLLASVLLDLSQSATLQAGGEVAESVISELRQVGRVHGYKVQQAGFMVLKAPDIPSLLIETAFISNPDEERNLIDTRHQERIAGAIKQGIRSYFHDSPPRGSKLALAKRGKEASDGKKGKEHAVSQGETLADIAEQYNISATELRSYNALNNDRLRVGQVLIIPRRLM
jgi:N-acetylmuramoyl-L-alanine amidase